MGKDVKKILSYQGLYDSRAGSEATYSASQIGPMLLNRLLAQKTKIFLNGAAGAQKGLPKTLILADPTRSAWSPEKTQQVQEIIQTLLDAKFTVYLAQQHQLVPITSVDKLTIMDRESLVQDCVSLYRMTKDKILERSSTLKNKPRSEIGFLDPQTISILLKLANGENENTDMCLIDTVEIQQLHEKITPTTHLDVAHQKNMNLLLDIIKDQKKLKSVNLEDIKNLLIPTEDELAMYVSPNVEQLTLKDNFMIRKQLALLTQIFVNLKELSIENVFAYNASGGDVDEWEVQHLETLRVSGRIGYLVSDILKQSRALKALIVNDAIEIATNENYECESLETLIFTGNGTVEDTVLNGLLMSSENLKILKVSVRVTLGHDDEFGNSREDLQGFLEGVYLNTLEVIDVSNGNYLDAQTLYALIEVSPNLRELNISNRRDLDNFILPPNMKKLKTVIARGVSFNPESREKLIEAVQEGAFLKEPIAAYNKIKFDVNTRVNNVHYKLTSIFRDKNGKNVDPHLIRMDTWDKMDFIAGEFHRGDEKDPFEVSNSADPKLNPCPNLIKSKKDLSQDFQQIAEDPTQEKYYLAKLQQQLSSDWTALPSLTPNDVMTRLSCLELSPEDYEIQYSQRDSQYHIRLLNGITPRMVNLNYILRSPVILPAKPEWLAALQKEYGESKINELPQNYQSGSSQDWMNALIIHRAGACRHKALAFYQEIKDRVAGCRIVTNRCHAFVEAQKNPGDLWVKYDLGGYEGSVTLDNTLFEPKPEPMQVQLTPQEIEDQLPINPAFAQDKPEEQKPPKASAFEYLTHYSNKNSLVDLKGNEEVEQFQQLLREVALSTDHPFGTTRPLFYIDGPDDINCHLPKIARNANNQVTFTEGLGGPLYDFLQDHSASQPVIVVNWNRFTAEEIVKFNSLIDKERRVDGVNIPIQTTVIGLYNSHKPDAYPGEDFSSRFDDVFSPSFIADKIKSALKPRLQTDNPAKTEHVYLHQSADWQSILFGSWLPTETGWVFEEGALIKARKTNCSLTLHDCPWKDRDFQNFMTRARIEKNIWIAGKQYQIPDDFIRPEGASYSLATEAKNCIKLQMSSSGFPSVDNPKVLNPTTLIQFFRRYRVEDGRLVIGPGWLESVPQGSSIPVYLTHPLSNGEWGQLVEAANKKGITLEIFCSPEVILPDAIRFSPSFSVHQSPVTRRSTLKVIETKQVAHVIKKILSQANNPLVIDCASYELSDLFSSINPIPQTNNKKFEQSEGAVITALKSGRDVILRGSFSPELEQTLCQWAIEDHPGFGKLTLVTDTALPALMRLSDYSKPEPEVVKQHKAESYHESPSQDFMSARIELFFKAIQNNIIVSMEGPTGVGKSTLMHDFIAKELGVSLYTGLEAFDAWASDTSSLCPILFIDEANLTEDQKKEWTEFAGMMNNDPLEIVMNGKTIKLSHRRRHRVVFASNPIEYGGERQNPALFEHYPIATLHLNPLPLDYIRRTVLEPLLGGWPAVCDELMKVYSSVQDHSENKSLITTRELEHMAHLFLLYYTHDETLQVQLAKACASQVLPSSKTIPTSSLSYKTNNPFKGYSVTQSRESLESRLNEFLLIRSYKRQGLISGGLGGIVLEGVPGNGKSEHVIAQLVANELKENIDFYRIPVAMSYSDKKKLLTKAFHEGAIVVIDEINSQPAMEKFFNDALSGKLDGVKARNPGFLLIGTQNPDTLEGRRKWSVAMERRTLRVHVPRHLKEEMVEILMNIHHLPQSLAREIVKDFEKANTMREKPLPFRTLIKKFEEALPFIVQTLSQRNLDQEGKRALFTAILNWRGAPESDQPVKKLARFASTLETQVDEDLQPLRKKQRLMNPFADDVGE